MEAGRYYVGDLCYVFNQEDWDEVCALTIKGNECLSGEFEMKDGRKFAMYNTKYGDGVYRDQYGNKFAVDSGTIGCVLLEHASRITPEELDHVKELGAVIDFQHPFSTGYDKESGLIMICSNHIQTGDDDDYETNDGWYDEQYELESDYE